MCEGYENYLQKEIMQEKKRCKLLGKYESSGKWICTPKCMAALGIEHNAKAIYMNWNYNHATMYLQIWLIFPL